VEDKQLAPHGNYVGNLQILRTSLYDANVSQLPVDLVFCQFKSFYPLFTDRSDGHRRRKWNNFDLEETGHCIKIGRPEFQREVERSLQTAWKAQALLEFVCLVQIFFYQTVC
jgi:hypothetical protein